MSDDCFVRYRVTKVAADPPGTAPRKQFGVEWMTYAFTGCCGDIEANEEATFDLGELPDLGGESVAAPVVHGIYQLVPAGWTGATEEPRVEPPPVHSHQDPAGAATLAEARDLPYWRDPTLPEDWVFDRASSGGLIDPAYGYCARYLAEPRPSPVYGGELRRFPGLEVCGYHADLRGGRHTAAWNDGASIAETRMIAGRPAFVSHSPPGPNHNAAAYVRVWVYDAATESEYSLIGIDGDLRGDRIDPLIAIARSLFEEG